MTETAFLDIPRLLFAAPQSGSGKTTVVCAVLRALLNKKLRVTAFKSGPDYIDPMFHSKVIGAKSRNLDLFLTGPENVKRLLAKNSKDSGVAILEGAMGFYDGMGKTAEASAYDLARTVKAPVVLIINGKGAALSLAALVKGFKDFQQKEIEARAKSEQELKDKMAMQETIRKAKEEGKKIEFSLVDGKLQPTIVEDKAN